MGEFLTRIPHGLGFRGLGFRKGPLGNPTVGIDQASKEIRGSLFGSMQ